QYTMARGTVSLRLHDAPPVRLERGQSNMQIFAKQKLSFANAPVCKDLKGRVLHTRSEEHTSELQSRENLVCRLLLEKKKTYENLLALLTLDRRQEAVFLQWPADARHRHSRHRQ